MAPLTFFCSRSVALCLFPSFFLGLVTTKQFLTLSWWAAYILSFRRRHKRSICVWNAMPVVNNSCSRIPWVNFVFLEVRQPAFNSAYPVFLCVWILNEPVGVGMCLLLNWCICYWKDLTLHFPAELSPYGVRRRSSSELWYMEVSVIDGFNAVCVNR